MDSHIYILTDGKNTKIGITTDLRKRISSYQTHNPNFLIHKTYVCHPEHAKRIESAIKSAFKDRLSGKSREWFQIGAEHIEKYVSALIQNVTQENLTPAMHGVPLTDDAYDLKEKIRSAISKGKEGNFGEINRMKNEFAELFSNHFRLGIPRHKLPVEIVLKDAMGLDLIHCDPQSSVAQNAARRNHVQLPCDDHIHTFYHLVRLGSGHHIAIGTARVSMPYLEAMKNTGTQLNEMANQLGWYVTTHNHWSWHSPEKTGLILYQQKTPTLERLSSWDNSFRKWVIERSELLKQDNFHDKEKLENTIEDIVHDCKFPTEATSYQDLFKRYIGVYHAYSEEDFYYREVYEFLFKKWLAQKN